MKNDTKNEKKVLESVQENIYNIQSLAKVLKLATATNYSDQVCDEDIAAITNIIINESKTALDKVFDHI